MSYSDDLARLQRKRGLAQALIQQGAQPQGMQAGRVFVGPTAVSGLASLASIIAGGVMDRKLEKKEDTLKDGRRKQLADMLSGMTGQSKPTDPSGFPIDTSRPKLQNPDGSFSTEETITVGMDGRQYNIPTIWNGQRLGPDQAVAKAREAMQRGEQFPSFGSIPEAEQAARARSSQIGAVRGSASQSDPQRESMLSFLQGLPIEQQEALVGQQALAKLFPKPPEEYTLGQGETRFRGNQKIAEGTPKPVEPVAKIQEYQQAVKDGFKGSFLDYLMALMKAGREPKENNTYRPMTPDEISAAGLPPGTSAQIDNNGKIDVLSKRDNSGALSQKDQTTAKMKLNTIKLARQQLSNIRDKFLGPQDPNTGIRDAGKGIKGGISAGPFGQGRLPTEGGQSFDRAVDQMRSTLTALTRVPGVGAMSDYETRLDQAKFPSRINYESVTEDQIDQLDNMLNAIASGYSDLLSKSQPEVQVTSQNATQPGIPQPDMQTRVRGYYK